MAEMGVKEVQRWVITALIITTAIHFVGGLLLMADYLDRPDAFWVLTLVSCAIMGLSISGCLVLHKKSPISFWQVFTLVPFIVSWIWVK